VQEKITRPYLYLLVFSAGFTTLGVELSASRLLDPWFGNSLIVWAALIGLLLLYLAAGYWLGGRLADRSPQPVTLLRLIAVGALGVGLVPAVSRPVLQLASRGLADFNAGQLAGSMTGILVLFAIPVTLLGCASPFAIRLSIRNVQGSGALAGRISALSTAGSILGSFLPVLLLIPNIGTRRTFATLSIVLLLVILAGFLLLRRRADAVAALSALILVACVGWWPAGPIKPAAGLLFETESAYNYIQVVDAGGVERQLRLNEGEGIHSVYRPQGGLADGIWDYFLLAPAFNRTPYVPNQVRRVAIIGLAAGTTAKLLTEAYGPIEIDGAELDPAIIAAGRTWFDMNEPNLNAVAADGRWFLAHGSTGQSASQRTNEPTNRRIGESANQRTDEGTGNLRFDLIVIDAYRPPYIPFHLTTVEFFTLARDRLAEDGVLAINVGRTHTDYSLVEAIVATLGQVFPSVYVMDEPDNGSPLGNSLVIATCRPTTLADFRANLPAFDHPLLAEVTRRAAGQARVLTPPPGTPVFTDDRAPVEQVVHTLVLKYMLGDR